MQFNPNGKYYILCLIFFNLPFLIYLFFQHLSDCSHGILSAIRNCCQYNAPCDEGEGNCCNSKDNCDLNCKGELVCGNYNDCNPTEFPDSRTRCCTNKGNL